MKPSLNGLDNYRIPKVYGGVGTIGGIFILLIKFFSVWNLFQVGIVIASLLAPYFILSNSGSAGHAYNNEGFTPWINLSHKFIFAVSICIASEYYDNGALLSLSDLFTYMIALAAYSCFDSLYFCYVMCFKA